MKSPYCAFRPTHEVKSAIPVHGIGILSFSSAEALGSLGSLGLVSLALVSFGSLGCLGFVFVFLLEMVLEICSSSDRENTSCCLNDSIAPSRVSIFLMMVPADNLF